MAKTKAKAKPKPKGKGHPTATKTGGVANVPTALANKADGKPPSDKVPQFTAPASTAAMKADTSQPGAVTPAGEIPLAPSKADAVYGKYGSQLQAEARARYQPKSTDLANQSGLLERHDSSVDGVYDAYARHLAEAAQNARTERHQTLAALTAAAQQAGAQTAGLQAGIVGAAGDSNQVRGGAGSSALGDAAAMIAQGAGQSGEIAGVQQTQLAAQGQAQDDRLTRLGAIQEGARATAHGNSAAERLKLQGARTSLDDDIAAFKTSRYGQMLDSDTRNEIAMATLSQKERDSLRDAQTQRDQFKTQLQIAQAGNNTQLAVAGMQIKSKAEIAAMDRATREEYYKNQAAHWERADDVAAVKAQRSADGATVFPVHAANGTVINFTAGERAKWSAQRAKLDNARRLVKGELDRASSLDEAIKKVMADTGLRRNIVAPLADYVRNTYVGPAGYQAIASIMPHGVVPPGLWQKMPPSYKAQVTAKG